MAAPMSRPALSLVTRELMRRNGLTNGMLYMQVTRGVAPRDHKVPKASTKPALVMTTRQPKPHSEQVLSEGHKVITATAQRWDRCDLIRSEERRAGKECVLMGRPRAAT